MIHLKKRKYKPQIYNFHPVKHDNDKCVFYQNPNQETAGKKVKNMSKYISKKGWESKDDR